MNKLKRNDKFRIGQIPFDKIMFSEALDQLVPRSTENSGCRQVVVANAYSIVIAERDAHFASICNEADFVLTDGLPVVWASRLLGGSVPERIAGPDLMWSLAKRISEKGLRVFLLGGRDADLEMLKTNLQREFSSLRIAGSYSPPFGVWSEAENDKILDKINSAATDVLWVGVSTPKQDFWIAKNKDRLNAKLAIGFGAAFDFHSGKVARAPAWVQRIGLEWFFRLVQDPKRLWRRYLIGNSVFITIVSREAIRNFSKHSFRQSAEKHAISGQD